MKVQRYQMILEGTRGEKVDSVWGDYLTVCVLLFNYWTYDIVAVDDGGRCVTWPQNRESPM